MGSDILGSGAILLVAVGAAVAGLRVSWRGLALALALQYVGVGLLLAVTSGWVAGVTTVFVAVGIEALLALDNEERPTEIDLDAPALEIAASIAPAGLSSSDPRSPRHSARSRDGRSGTLQRQGFELSVIALAIVGAGELAMSRPLVGQFATDVVINILTLSGLLYCLIGPPVRAAGGLLFIASAGSVLLHAADPFVPAGETLLLAVAQLALALALVSARAASRLNEKVP